MRAGLIWRSSESLFHQFHLSLIGRLGSFFGVWFLGFWLFSVVVSFMVTAQLIASNYDYFCTET